MLTIEQQATVAKNHNLIYAYAHRRGLDIEEWYGVLAIELCLAVENLDTTRSTLSTYFNLRATSIVNKEYQRSLAQKNTCNGLYELNNELHSDKHVNEWDIADLSIELNDLVDADESGILELRRAGYLQTEIAEKLNVTQAKVSRTIRKFKKGYYDR